MLSDELINYKNCTNCASKNIKFEVKGKDYNYFTLENEFNWFSCNDCGHFFLGNRPNKKIHKHIYPEILKNYDFFSNDSLSFKIKNYLTYIQLKKYINKTKKELAVLDVGCAAGMFLDIIKFKFNQFTNFDGLEISEAASRKAKEKGYNVFNSLIEDFKFTKKYDLISMQQVIEHVHEPEKVIKNIFDNLNNGGILLIETPNPDCFDRKIFKGYWEGYHIPRHFNLFTIPNLKEMLKIIGFSKVIVSRKIKPVHWTISIKHYLKDKKKLSFIHNRISETNTILNIIFSIIDLFQILFFKKSSDVSFIAIK